MNKFLSQSETIELDCKGVLNVNLTLNPSSKGNLILIVHGDGEINLKITAAKNSEWKYLWLNKSSGELVVKETLVLMDDATLSASYGEMSYGFHEKELRIHYQGHRALCELTAAVMTFGSLKWHLLADHKATDGYSSMNTNAIIVDEGHLNLEVAGAISKGCVRSKTHQMSRILNLGTQSQAIVFPKLLIDENDVEASHAASVGQANEDHIYYLQSRGLSRVQALKLLIKGYLMPVVHLIDDEIIKDSLIQEIEEKVSSYV